MAGLNCNGWLFCDWNCWLFSIGMTGGFAIGTDGGIYRNTHSRGMGTNSQRMPVGWNDRSASLIFTDASCMPRCSRSKSCNGILPDIPQVLTFVCRLIDLLRWSTKKSLGNRDNCGQLRKSWSAWYCPVSYGFCWSVLMEISGQLNENTQ